MLSEQTLQAYRRMSNDERLALTLQAMRESFPYLCYGSAEAVDRKFELIRRENDARNRSMLERLAQAEGWNEKP